MRVRVSREGAPSLPGWLRLSGHTTGVGIPADEVLWVDVPEEMTDDLTDRLDAWLVLLLPYAFENGQDVLIDGPVDARLLRNVHELMEVWCSWRPGKRPVRIEAESADASERSDGRTGLFFTAGVDSFYALLHHDQLASLHPEWRLNPVSDLIYVEGYDIPLTSRPALTRKRAALQTVATETGKTLVTLVTNFRETSLSLQPRAWGPIVHGSAIVAGGLLFARRWNTLLLSASFGYNELDPWGSHIVTDPLLSTADTRVWHYGAHAASDRLAKVEFLAQFDVALQHLHVCWQDSSDRNCGACEKCFRTLLALDLAGARHRTVSFPAGTFSVGRLRDVWTEKERVVRVYRGLRAHADRLGRTDVVAIIDECLARPRQVSRVEVSSLARASTR